MKRSTTSADRSHRLWAVAFWIAVWQLLAMAVGQRVLLASPLETAKRLIELIPTLEYWRSILFTLGHILAGFLAACLAGTLLAALSARFGRIAELLAPLLATIRSIPVASFVIVALIWVPSRRLSVLISFLIAMPIVYAGVLDGIHSADPQLIEMARIFRMTPLNRLAYLYLPSILPRFATSAGVAIGLAWKSGVAAEVIGIPGGSIGEKLYRAKIYLATPDLFAWTLTIVALSVLCERAIRALLALAQRRMEGR